MAILKITSEAYQRLVQENIKLKSENKALLKAEKKSNLITLTKAAEMLGITRATLYAKVKQYKIKQADEKQHANA